MDASVIVVCFLVLCFGGLSMQFPQQDGGQDQDVTTASNNNNDPTNIDNSTAVRCATARDVPGNCVERRFCEFSTTAIDFTLYATKKYKKPCPDNETCCPFSSVIIIETKSTWDDQKPTFDENDKK